MSSIQAWARGALAVLLLGTAACGGGDSKQGGPTDPGSDAVATSVLVEGDDQVGATRGELSNAGRVVVLDQNQQPMSGVTVTFQPGQGSGSLAQASAVTGANGRASVPTWTLGPAVGVQTLTARVAGVNDVATVRATARLPKWTVMVYLAADNTLAIPGIYDLDELEAAGSSADVRVVVQAEFSPQQLAQVGCNAGCFNRPNFNTFRYVVPRATGGANPRGPNQPVVDIGNRNMVEPAQLAEFIAWAKDEQPAEHYALVLWNHGGGYTGLIEDVTSGGTRLMTMAELREALPSDRPLDLVDFDMCLMGGFETLVSLKGRAQHVVFSEEVVPGEGNPYTRILNALRQNPDRSPAQFASMIVDEFHTSFSNSRSSTTMSAYAMSGLPAAEAAIGNLAASLRGNLQALAPTIGAASAAAQKFEYPQLTDLGDMLDTLDARVADQGVRAQIAAVRAAVEAPAFRLNSKVRRGSDAQAADVRRARGLHILLPSGQPGDAMPSTGPASLASYRALYPDAPWTAFLTDYLATAGAGKQYVDQGSGRIETYVIWDTTGISRGVDVDMWVLEPDGNLYSPAFGSVSPNGRFTADSYDSKQAFEGWLTNQHLQVGRYSFYAFLYADPQGRRPLVDLIFRTRAADDFSSVWSPNYPRLEKANSIADDPTPSFEEIEAGAYGDVKRLAFLDLNPPGAAPLVASLQPATTAGTMAAQRDAAPAPRPTAAQLRTVQRLVQQPRAHRAATAAQLRGAKAAVARAQRALAVLP